jgi:sugar lactone lactonase YvrE
MGAMLLLIPAIAGFLLPSAHAFSNGQNASVVVGAVNFGGASQYRANGPEGIAFDSSGNLWVADYPANRVLRFPAPFTNGMSANLVIGQPDFTSSNPATSQAGLYGPVSLIFDSGGNLWVVDSNNHRVLKYSPPFTNGMNANLVLGQSAFTLNQGQAITTANSLYFPYDARFDATGNLWVADCGNDRVLRYAQPFSNGMAANLVLGQPGFTTYSSATTQNGLSCPTGLAFGISGNLLVSDYYNNRILGFGGGFSNGMNANLVIGQSSFATSTASGSQSGLDGPWGMAVDSSGNLWVVDSNNYRVVAFAAPFSTAESALLVVGQSGLTTSSGPGQTWFSYATLVAFDPSGNLWVTDNGNGAILRFARPFSTGEAAGLVIGQGQNTVTRPIGLAIDSTGSLWAADFDNDRVLQFAPPFTNGMNANLEIGQPSFTTNSFVTTQSTFTAPVGVAFDSSGNLWVADSISSRILRFSPPFSNGESANLVLGQSDFTSSSAATSQSGLNFSSGIAFDTSGNLWVSDTDNNRVLRYSSPFSNGERANLVIGQSAFTTDAFSATQTGLNGPAGIAFDSTGNLWLSDIGNNRVLRFAPPFTNGMPANLVLGQTLFTSSTNSTSQNGMHYPEGIAFDPRGNLWVVDYGNNRVLRFRPPFATAMGANLVLGQSGFTSNAYAANPNMLNGPRSIAIDSAGNAWVSDEFNNRIVQFSCGSECPPAAFSASYGVQGGGAGLSPPTLTYMSGGVPKTVTLTATPTSYSMDYGSTWSVTGTLAGSTSSERWATNQPTSGTASGTQAVSFNFYHQYNVKLGYNITGGGTGYGSPSVSYSQFGTQISSSAGSTAWVDSGSSYSYQNPLVGSSSSERWFATATTCTVTSAAPVSIAFYHQYSFTATYTVSGGGSPTAPTLTSTSLGSPTTTLLSAGGQAVWLDSGASFSLTNPLGGSTASERWYTSQATGKVSGAVATLVYYHQYLATASYSIVGGGTPPAPALNATSTGVVSAVSLSTTSSPVWLDASSSYTLPSTLSTSSATERWQTSAATTGTVSSAITLIPAYYHQYLITASYTVTGGGTPSTPSLTYASAGASSSLSLTTAKQTLWADSGSQYTATNPLGGSTSSERWSSPAALGSVAGSASMVLQYHHQYLITFAVTDNTGKNSLVPSNFSLSVQGVGAQSVQGLASWVDSGANFTISHLFWQGADVKPAGQYSVTGPATIAVKALVYEATVKVSDVLGLPVAGATVKMTLANGSVVSGTTGGDGTFVAPDIPLGTYTASISGIGSSTQVTGDASKQGVATASVLFGTISIGVIVAIVIVAVGLAVFMMRRRSGGAAKAAKPAQATALVCPKCGSSVEPSDPFCPNCGTKLR